MAKCLACRNNRELVAKQMCLECSTRIAAVKPIDAPLMRCVKCDGVAIIPTKHSGVCLPCRQKT